MFGPFWIAKHTVRAFTPRRRYRNCSNQSGDSGGCIVAILIVAVFMGIVGANSGNTSQAPVCPPTGPCWWVEDTHGQLHPAVDTGVPFASPYAAPAAATTHWGLIGFGAAVLLLMCLAIIGWRMTPQLIRANRAITLINNTCCGQPVGAPHTNTCHNRQPPENPARWSDRR